MKKNNESHIFAIFVHAKNMLVDLKKRTIFLKDVDAIKRIMTVLRLQVGEPIILFDEKMEYGCTLDEITKKHITLSVRNEHAIELQTPEIDIVVPLLERAAFEEVVYMATVYGVRKIYPVITEKGRKKISEKEFERLHKIALSAAEQSKHFHLPVINHIAGMSHVLSLETFLTKHITDYKSSTKIWCDIHGTSLLDLLARDKKPYMGSYLMTFGPEGDFTHKEKQLLAQFFTPVKLAKNVLRAKDAASLAMGILRAHTVL